VQKKMKKTITFTLNMRQAPPFKDVGIRGGLPPLSWQESLPMFDPDGDSLYSASVELETGQYGLEFKFETDGTYELCGEPNRLLRFRYEPETLEYRARFDRAGEE
jgi:hypothetical protein